MNFLQDYLVVNEKEITERFTDMIIDDCYSLKEHRVFFLSFFFSFLHMNLKLTNMYF